MVKTMSGKVIMEYMLEKGFRPIKNGDLMFDTTHHFEQTRVHDVFVALDNKSMIHSERLYSKEAVDEFIDEIKEEHERLAGIRDKIIAYAKEKDPTSYYDKTRNSLIVFDKSWNFYVKKRLESYVGRFSLNTSTRYSKDSIEELEKTLMNRVFKQLYKECPSDGWVPKKRNILGCFFSNLKGYDARKRKFPYGVTTKLKQKDILSAIGDNIAHLSYKPIEMDSLNKFYSTFPTAKEETFIYGTKVLDFIYVKTDKKEHLIKL